MANIKAEINNTWIKIFRIGIGLMVIIATMGYLDAKDNKLLFVEEIGKLQSSTNCLQIESKIIFEILKKIENLTEASSTKLNDTLLIVEKNSGEIGIQIQLLSNRISLLENERGRNDFEERTN